MANVTIFIPNPLDSDRQFDRFHHYDLADTDTRDLLCELVAGRCQVWVLGQERYGRILGHFEQKRRIAWLQERIGRIEDELSRRRYAGRETKETRIQPKPKLAKGVVL